jgi:hypothetical protein
MYYNFNYNLTCTINIVFYFELRDFRDTCIMSTCFYARYTDEQEWT